MLTSTNPATGETVAEYDEHTDAQVRALIDEAHDRQLEWRRTSFAHRAGILRAAADQRTGAVASHVVGRSVAAVLATLCLAPTLLFVAPSLAPAAASAVLAVALGLVMEGTYHAARSAGRHRLCALLLTVNSLTWAALVVALVLVEGWGVTGLMLALAGSHLAGWCVGLVALGPSAWSGATRPEMVRQLRFGAPIALTDILHVAAGLDRLVVQQLLGLAGLPRARDSALLARGLALANVGCTRLLCGPSRVA